MTADSAALHALATLDTRDRDQVLELVARLDDRARVPLYVLYGGDRELDAARLALADRARCAVIDLTALVGGRTDLTWRSPSEVVADTIRTIARSEAPRPVLVDNFEVVLTALSGEVRSTEEKVLRLLALRRLAAPVVIVIHQGGTVDGGADLESILGRDGRQRIFVLSQRPNPTREAPR